MTPLRVLGILWVAAIGSRLFACVYGVVAIGKIHSRTQLFLRRLLAGLGAEGALFISAILLNLAAHRRSPIRSLPDTIVGTLWLMMETYVTYATWRFVLHVTGRTSNA